MPPLQIPNRWKGVTKLKSDFKYSRPELPEESRRGTASLARLLCQICWYPLMLSVDIIIELCPVAQLLSWTGRVSGFACMNWGDEERENKMFCIKYQQKNSNGICPHPKASVFPLFRSIQKPAIIDPWGFCQANRKIEKGRSTTYCTRDFVS